MSRHNLEELERANNAANSRQVIANSRSMAVLESDVSQSSRAKPVYSIQYQPESKTYV